MDEINRWFLLLAQARLADLLAALCGLSLAMWWCAAHAEVSWWPLSAIPWSGVAVVLAVLWGLAAAWARRSRDEAAKTQRATFDRECEARHADAAANATAKAIADYTAAVAGPRLFIGDAVVNPRTGKARLSALLVCGDPLGYTAKANGTHPSVAISATAGNGERSFVLFSGRSECPAVLDGAPYQFSGDCSPWETEAHRDATRWVFRLLALNLTQGECARFADMRIDPMWTPTDD